MNRLTTFHECPLVTCITPDRPQQPRNVRSVNTTSRSISLVWEEPHDNNAPIMGYRVMYQEPTFLGDGEQVVNSTVEMAEITDLYPGVTYNFTVVAFNEIGDSTPSSITPVTTSEEGSYIYSQPKFLICNQVYWSFFMKFIRSKSKHFKMLNKPRV